MTKQNKILHIYNLLFDHFGPQNWWPAESPFEIMVGAVLTQNTNWANVVKALDNLIENECLSYAALSEQSLEEIAVMIRPSGYHNLKAKRLKNLLEMIEKEYEGELEFLVADSTDNARENLLRVKGIGPETADAILLYCGNHPVFVVDTYTHRVFSRHNLVEESCDYHDLQQLFYDALPAEPELFNEYHALIVQVGKDFCKKSKPYCEECPLNGYNC